MRGLKFCLAGAGLIAVMAVPLLVAASATPKQDRMDAQFKRTVWFSERLLNPGNYLIVHDDEKKAAGEPCLYVYSESNLDEPLVSIHCIRRERIARDESMIALGDFQHFKQVTYVQFAGDSFAHYLR